MDNLKIYLPYLIADIEVRWTGFYPNIENGEWIIKINGTRIIDTQEKSVLTQSFGICKISEVPEDDGEDAFYCYCDEDASDCYCDGYEMDSDGERLFLEADEIEVDLSYEDWSVSPQFKELNNIIKDNNFFLTKTDLIYLYMRLKRHDWDPKVSSRRK